LFARLVPLASDVIPWDGPVAQVITHDGHAPGHSAVFLPDFGVLVAGDMLSDIEIPLLDTELCSPPLLASPVGDYHAGLNRLAALDGVRCVVPGHGHVGDTTEFRRRVDADRRYLDALTAGEPFDDPRLADGPDWLRQTHDEQVRRLAPGLRPAHFAC
jgi:glyoxylase-like metal-dependent hydrolase (beta-lactamase superfamily II)